MKSLLHLTVKEIKTGALKTILPELYELKKVYETGSWHNHQQVFEHILRVFSYLKKYSRNNLLLWAGLLHDIGKKDSIANHVLIGARKAEKILARWKFSPKERDYIVTIVKLHGKTTDLNQVENLRRRYPEIDTDWYAAEGLNIPKNHPARDDQETFYITSDIVLTAHTSNGQLHEMELMKTPPIKMINIGKTYRRQASNTHSPMFHQFEGMLIDTDVSITQLITNITTAAAAEAIGSSEITNTTMNTRAMKSKFPAVILTPIQLGCLCSAMQAGMSLAVRSSAARQLFSRCLAVIPSSFKLLSQ